MSLNVEQSKTSPSTSSLSLPLSSPSSIGVSSSTPTLSSSTSSSPPSSTASEPVMTSNVVVSVASSYPAADASADMLNSPVGAFSSIFKSNVYSPSLLVTPSKFLVNPVAWLTVPSTFASAILSSVVAFDTITVIACILPMTIGLASTSISTSSCPTAERGSSCSSCCCEGSGGCTEPLLLDGSVELLALAVVLSAIVILLSS